MGIGWQVRAEDRRKVKNFKKQLTRISTTPPVWGDEFLKDSLLALKYRENSRILLIQLNLVLIRFGVISRQTVKNAVVY